MKRRAFWILAAVLFLSGILVYANRGTIRDTWNAWMKPKLPPAQEFVMQQPQSVGSEAQEAPTIQPETGSQEVPTSSTVASLEKDPLAWNGVFPAEVNIAVPFLLQAPYQNWVEPFENACEEASLIMVDAFYQGRHANFAAAEGEEAILKVVAYEDGAYGYNKDTNTPEVALTAKNYFGYQHTIIRTVNSADDLKSVLANGYPVIVPAYGKALKNPNFRNGGPDYHMLVVKGYTKDGLWITNDPGTRNGPDYLYKQDVLLNAIHSFTEGNMQAGAKEMIVVLPNS